tara:strand:+ start:159 stop:920 length:762 start_codon:yes stop_codon:yes gene_type:complete
MKNSRINIITSFPKSGNTWVRFIIYDLLFNDQNVDIKNSSEINRMIPDFHMSKNNQLILDSELKDKQIFLKTHSSYEQMSKLPIGKIIIIIRNPFDVLVSLYNYYNISKNERDEMLNYFCSHQTLPFLKKANLPSWQDHIESWVNSGKEYHIVKYSNLIDDFDNQIKSLCNFLNYEISDKKIEFVKRNTSFDNLKRIEKIEREGNISGFFSGNMRGKTTNFMNKGGYGNYNSFFSQLELSKLENSFKKNKWIS